MRVRSDSRGLNWSRSRLISRGKQLIRAGERANPSEFKRRKGGRIWEGGARAHPPAAASKGRIARSLSVLRARGREQSERTADFSDSEVHLGKEPCSSRGLDAMMVVRVDLGRGDELTSSVAPISGSDSDTRREGLLTAHSCLSCRQMSRGADRGGGRGFTRGS